MPQLGCADLTVNRSDLSLERDPDVRHVVGDRERGSGAFRYDVRGCLDGWRHYWNSLGVLNPAQDPIGGSDRYPYTNNGLDTPPSWHIASADLTPYVGSRVQVRFRFDSVDLYDNGFRGWLIDDVGVYSTDSSVPIVSTVTPDSGAAGSTVTITCYGFGSQQGTGKLTFKNIPAQVQSWSNNQIVATVPQGAASGARAEPRTGILFAALLCLRTLCKTFATC